MANIPNALVVLLIFVESIAGQTIVWEENFDNYADGVIVAENNNTQNPDPDWYVSGCLACIDTADWWEVRSGSFEARDVNQVVFLQTESIDISNLTDVSFSMQVSESGDLEGLYFGLDACADQEKEDYVNVLYRIDGQEWILVENYLGWCGLYDSCGSHTLYGDDGINSGDCRSNDSDWGTATVTVNKLSGNSLELRCEVINSSTTEYIRIDNLMVSGQISLPVVWASFELTTTGSVVNLQWETATERHNSHFQVQRSGTGTSDWMTIGRVPGSDYSDETISYSFIDSNPMRDRAYYRLMQVDYDGTYEHGPIKSIETKDSMLPYPNPAANFLNIPSAHQIRLFDFLNKEVLVIYSNNSDGIRLDISGLSPGNYVLWNLRGDNWEKHKILILR